MKILCDENIVGLEQLAGYADILTAPGRAITRSMLAGVDALWVRSVTRVDRPLLEGTPVRFVGTATAGVEHIDQAYLAEAGIAFSAAPGANANAVVEFVLGVFSHFRLPWERLDAGGRLAIVGAGEVGSRLACVARSLGWDCLLCDPPVEEMLRGGKASQQWSEDPHGGGVSRVDEVLAPSDGGVAGSCAWCSLEEALRCEVISLHCALHRDAPWPSWHLLDGATLAGLAADQWLVNAARGAVIDNAALLARLRGGNAPQVVLDVWEGEPELDVRLLECRSLRLATPHIAGYSWDAKWQATLRLFAATPGLGGQGREFSVQAPAAPPVTWAQGADALEQVRRLFGESLQLEADDRSLRALAEMPAAVRAQAFDQLRREYPQRREIRGRSLSSEGGVRPDARGVQVLAALGVGTWP